MGIGTTERQVRADHSPRGSSAVSGLSQHLSEPPSVPASPPILPSDTSGLISSGERQMNRDWIGRPRPYSAPDSDKNSLKVNGELSIVRPHRGESHAVPAGMDDATHQ